MRLNCLTMPKRSYGTYQSRSFCEGYSANQMSEGGVFTHDPGSARNAERRAQNCPSGTCTALTNAAKLASGVSTLGLDCDEFPPASAEEGGSSFSWQAGVLCVPSYQNQQHGQCISESTYS